MNPPMRVGLAVVLLASALTACAPERLLPDRSAKMWIQSVLYPHGSHAAEVANLGLVMTIGAAVILTFVVILSALAILLPQERRRWMTGKPFVLCLGVVFPIVSLTVLLTYGISLGGTLLRPGDSALRIEVTGEQWWWRVRYLGAGNAPDIVSANEIRIPIGRPVEFRLRSDNVIHSFWAPSLAGKLDMIPGRVNTYRISAERPGSYRGQCAEFCGAQHALMSFYVIAMTEADFKAWAAREAAPAVAPTDPVLRQGQTVFLQNGCGACHTIQGTEARGSLGPDLTHVGGRSSVAAGTIPNTTGSFEAWITSSQHIKPGNVMPSFHSIKVADLKALAVYLESLK